VEGLHDIHDSEKVVAILDKNLQKLGKQEKKLRINVKYSTFMRANAK